jgi:hypothetical protein
LAVSCEEGNRKEKREKRKEKREKRRKTYLSLVSKSSGEREDDKHTIGVHLVVLFPCCLC